MSSIVDSLRILQKHRDCGCIESGRDGIINLFKV